MYIYMYIYIYICSKTEKNVLYWKQVNKKLLKVDLNNSESSKFIETFVSLIDKHTPKIQAFIRTNNAYFMTKNLRRTIISKINFRNRILTEKTEQSKILIISTEIFVWAWYVKRKEMFRWICTTKLFLDNKKVWKGAEKFFHK